MTLTTFDLLTEQTTNDQIHIFNGISWHQYQEITAGREGDSHYKISYLDRVLEIVSPGKKQEFIKELTGILIVAYCDTKDIEYYPLGSTTLKNESRKVAKEPDISYAIGEDKDIPDIAVEVNYSSGGVDDLARYLELGVPEVWMWEQDETLTFYLLANNQYSKREQSSVLKNLPSKLISKFVNLMTETSPRLAKKEFIKTIENL